MAKVIDVALGLSLLPHFRVHWDQCRQAAFEQRALVRGVRLVVLFAVAAALDLDGHAVALDGGAEVRADGLRIS